MSDVLYTFFQMILFWGVFIISFRIDRSRYRNCYFLFFALFFSIPFIVTISSGYSHLVISIILITFLIGVMLLPYYLIHNGFVMMRKEGKQLSHLLSLALGVLIFLGEVALIVNVLTVMTTYNFEQVIALKKSGSYIFNMLFGLSIVYVSASVMIFTIYIVLLQIIPWGKNYEYVIILGSGLIGGDRVPKLLGNRIDKAIEVYRKSKNRPKLIPSGGQGSDETISEAEAMKRYLIDKGIPEEDIILEDKSTSTYENLTNSKKIIDGLGGSRKVAIVSSNYHVYRALRYCRKTKFKCSGIGGRTALYYWPSALLREYIAVHAEKKHAVIFVIGWFALMIVSCFFLLY